MALCVPVRAQNSIEDHRQLIDTLTSVGITMYYNDPICDSGDMDGAYSSSTLQLVICQDNAKFNNGTRLETWTANDMDTLRHEAHHVVQDCVGGSIGDGELADLFREPEEFNQFVTNTIGDDRASSIARSYSENGASTSTIFSEIEAFAVADSVSAEVIGNQLVAICGIR